MRKQVVTSLIAASVFLGASPAPAQYAAYPDGREPAYYVTFYSDASHTTVVGTMTPHCGWSAVIYQLDGQTSYHSVSELLYYCPEERP
jgi:hypothetical protein